MIYRFTIISDEVDDFVREIQIDPESTFLDFHKAILKSVNFKDNQLTSFFTCSEDWEKETEVTLESMYDDSEYDSWVMSETKIEELVEDEKQRLIYIFDNMTDRCFFIELSEIITGKNIANSKCTKSEGNPPQQSIDFEEVINTKSNFMIDEDFYGDQDFDMEDFGEDGFNIAEGDTDLFDDRF